MFWKFKNSESFADQFYSGCVAVVRWQFWRQTLCERLKNRRRLCVEENVEESKCGAVPWIQLELREFQIRQKSLINRYSVNYLDYLV